MRIDIHSHFQCLDFVKHLVGRTGLRGLSSMEEPTSSSVRRGSTFPPFPGSSTWKRSFDMKIDIAVLSHGIPFGRWADRKRTIGLHASTTILRGSFLLIQAG